MDHFHEQVLALNKIGGQARVMVVTGSIDRAIRKYLLERKSPYQAIVAFSGEHAYGGAQVSEASLNGFPSSRIADEIQQDPYRFLICADKFQTGVRRAAIAHHVRRQDLVRDQGRADAVACQQGAFEETLVFVLDFMNAADTIQEAFADYYRTTILSEETDPQ